MFARVGGRWWWEMGTHGTLGGYKLEPKLTELYLAHRVSDIVVNLLLMFKNQHSSYNRPVSNLRAGRIPASSPRTVPGCGAASRK